MTYSQKGLTLALVLIAAMAMLSSCGSRTALSGPIDRAYCTTFQPIYWAEEDTDETIRAVKAHNAVWVSLCQSK